MMRTTALLMMLAVTSSVAMGSNLNVSVQANCGSNTCPNEVTVLPNGTVNYQVVGVLNDGASQGLALFGFDLSADGGIVLPRANVPTTGNMTNFVTPLGINNPPDSLGFGGTPSNGILKQCGGGQNTIKNTVDNAPFPIAETVVLNLALPPTPVVLLTGSLTAPSTPGNYNLSLTNLFGNVIKTGETGEPFYKTEAFGVGTTMNLVIRVPEPPMGRDLIGSTPASCTTANGSGSALWRSQNNIILLDFEGDDPLSAAPLAGELEINEIQAGGGFGPNLNDGVNFTFSVNGPQLRIQENGTVLQHRSWYAIRNTGGWEVANEFSVKLVLHVGDASNDGRVLAGDVSAINACVPCPNVSAGCANQACGVRNDINGDNRIIAGDVSIANSKVPSVPLNIPAGHTCP